MSLIVKSVVFSGSLDQDNKLVIDVDDNYCPIRVGKWAFRFDALSVTCKANCYKHLTVSTSLLESPQFDYIQVDLVKRKRLVLAPSPIHLFTVNALANARVQLIRAGTTGFDHFFSQGSPQVTLYFKDIEKADATTVTDLKLYVCGILLFNYMGM
jgi:hypothetical protein